MHEESLQQSASHGSQLEQMGPACEHELRRGKKEEKQVDMMSAAREMQR